MMPVALLLAAAVSAEPANPKLADYALYPAFAAWRAGYPPAAVEKGLTGVAAVLCHVTPTGMLVECRVEREQPADNGFGEAVIAMAAKARLKPAAAKAIGPLAWVRFSGAFSERLLNEEPAAWLKRPTQDQLNEAWPVKALKDGISGGAVMTCKIATSGALEGCVVVEEKPAGLGFGDAVLLLAPTFQMKPAVRDGKKVVSTVRIPINFVPRGGGIGNRAAEQATISVLQNAPFDRAPSYADLISAWPQGAPATSEDGKVVMRCRLRETGLLEACDFAFSSAARFEKPARDLAKKFRVRMDGDIAKQDLARVYVAVPIQFVNPVRADPARNITRAIWIGSLDAEQVAKLYPAEATKQGVKTGRGVVSCTVADTGRLVGCKAVEETPANLGFGGASVDAAQMMKMTLWGEDGLPTAGGTARLPIRIDQPNPG